MYTVGWEGNSSKQLDRFIIVILIFVNKNDLSVLLDMDPESDVNLLF